MLFSLQITMKNRLTNLVLLRDGSHEPSAPWALALASFSSLLMATNAAGHARPCTAQISLPGKLQSSMTTLPGFGIQVTCYTFQKGFLTSVGLSRRAGQSLPSAPRAVGRPLSPRALYSTLLPTLCGCLAPVRPRSLRAEPVSYPSWEQQS